MTKKQWADYLRPWIKGFSDDNEINSMQVAERVIAAINKERVGEVVLTDTSVKTVSYTTLNGLGKTYDIGKRGVLIFREQEGK